MLPRAFVRHSRRFHHRLTYRFRVDPVIASDIVDWYQLTTDLNQGQPLYSARLNQTMSSHIAAAAVTSTGSTRVAFGTG